MPKGKIRERKFIPPQESVTKYGYSKALFGKLDFQNGRFGNKLPKANHKNVSLSSVGKSDKIRVLAALFQFLFACWSLTMATLGNV